MSSDVHTVSYLEVLEKAYTGSWQLPEFQRELKWKVKQNILLFDSLRNRFPIGTFLTAKEGAISHVKPIVYSDVTQKPELLVLDGQQRITAGIQLFYANYNSGNQKTFYFIDLNKIEALLNIYQKSDSTFDLNNDDHIKFYGENHLEADDGYLVARQNVKDPNLLFKKGLVFTNLIRRDNNRDFDTYSTDFKNKSPTNKRLIEILDVLFRGKVDFNPKIPNIIVDSKDPKILTRIFSTLNNSGTSLTPFEITVSEMFGVGVNLIDELQAYTSKSIFLKNIDKDKTLMLQSCLMLAGSDHKKTSLPKNLNKDIWNNNKDNAFKAVEDMAEFLTTDMGLGLDASPAYIPYDTALLPLVYIFNKYDVKSMNATLRGIFTNIIRFYVVATALKTRFTEGAYSKQSTDKEKIAEAIDKNDYTILDNSFDKNFSGLNEVTNSGAKGKIILCIQNANGLKDPLTNSNISLSVKHEIHHIFPKEMLKRWGENKVNSVNHISNLMITSPSTNSVFSNQDPMGQVDRCKLSNGNYLANFETHFICEKCIEIMIRKGKGQSDYNEFIETRNKNIYEHIERTYKIKRAEEINEDDDQIDSDEAAS